MRKVYLCCSRQEKEKFKDLSERTHLDNIREVEQLEEAELVYAVQPVDTSMQKVLELAGVLKIPVIRMTGNFIPIDLYTAVLENRLCLE